MCENILPQIYNHVPDYKEYIVRNNQFKKLDMNFRIENADTFPILKFY